MGAINVKHTGSGAAIALSSDGTSLLLDGTAIGGGGGADLYAANESSPAAQPSATGTNAVAIGDSAVASGQESVAFSKSLASGRQSFAAALSSNSASYGAQGYHSVALGERSKATGYASVALGFGTATGDNSFACSTSNSGYASAVNSFAFGSSAQAAGSPSIAMGYQPEAKAEASVAMGYRTKVTSNGQGSSAFGIDSFVDVKAKTVFGGRNFSSNGDCQTGTTVLKGFTTDATAVQLASGYINATAAATNQVVLPNNSVYGFTGTIIARENSAQTNDFVVWEVKGGAVRAASASTTALGSYNINKISESTGAATWAIAISADTTNGAIAFTVTGEASHSIRWVATINTTEVTY